MVILCGTFLISSWFNATVTAYWKHLLSSLLLMGFIGFFIQTGESIYDPPQFRFILWHLQYNKLTQSKIKSFYLSFMFINYFDSYHFEFFNNFICILTNLDFLVITFECITRSFTLSLEEIKLIAIFNWSFTYKICWHYWCLPSMVYFY